jgi:hypothetical protein
LLQAAVVIVEISVLSPKKRDDRNVAVRLEIDLSLDPDRMVRQRTIMSVNQSIEKSFASFLPFVQGKSGHQEKGIFFKFLKIAYTLKYVFRDINIK